MRTKSRLKRILCLLLTLCMVISMQTATAVKADEPVEITSVDVSDITLPVVGATPDFDLSLPEGANYQFNPEKGVVWYNVFGTMSPTDEFEPGKTYYLVVKLIPNDGYKFADSVTMTMNGISELVNNDATVTSSEWITVYSSRFTMEDTAPVLEEITSVDVSDITLPVVGATPDFDVSLPEGANYHIGPALDVKGVEWDNLSDSVTMSPTDEFEPGKTYCLTVSLIPNDGYKFADSVTRTLNGSSELVANDVGMTRSEWMIFYSIEFTMEGTAPVLEKITSVDVSGVILPVEGNNPNFEVTVPEGAHYHLASEEELKKLGFIPSDSDKFEIVPYYKNGIGWTRMYELSEMGYLLPSSSFELDIEYYVGAVLVPNEGYEFADDVSATINGKAEYVGDGSKKGISYSIYSIGWKATAQTEPVTKYKVTVNNSYAENNGSGSYAPGTKVYIDAGTNPNGYRWLWWYGESESNFAFDDVRDTNTFFIMPQGDVTITAIWDIPGEIEVVYLSTEEPETGKTPSTELVSYEPDLYTGVITYWDPEDDPFKADTEYTVTINLEAIANDLFTSETKFYLNGRDLTLIAPDQIDGKIDQVTLACTFPKTKSDEVVNTYTLTTSVNGGHGTISEGKTGLAENSTETVIFTPDKGYEIDKVTVNGVETGVKDNVLDVKMDGNKTVVVTYKLIKQDGTVPPTGDNLTMLVALQAVSLSGLAAVCYIRKKREFSK